MDGRFLWALIATIKNWEEWPGWPEVQGFYWWWWQLCSPGWLGLGEVKKSVWDGYKSWKSRLESWKWGTPPSYSCRSLSLSLVWRLILCSVCWRWMWVGGRACWVNNTNNIITHEMRVIYFYYDRQRRAECMAGVGVYFPCAASFLVVAAPHVWDVGVRGG